MTGGRRVFYDVESSIGGRRWVHALDARGEALATEIAQGRTIPDVVARILVARGVLAGEAERFLAPTLRDLMPDPSTLTDMDKAAARLADAVERRERVAIFGDYDVDGAASSALVARYLRHLGLEPTIRIPDRLTEGYGLHSGAMGELADAGATLVVAVDCGTTSPDAAAVLAARRVDLVVLDHHQTGAQLPEAHAIVNPNRQDDLSGQGHLCAAGVVFLTLAAVSRELRRRGRPASAMHDLLAMLDLVALATVCDVVPLVGFNRALVVQGLQVMRSQKNAGLRALQRIARLSGPVETYHLGFILGPRLNASGRIGSADRASRLLMLGDDSEAEADEIAAELDELNRERQAVERTMLAEAEAEVAAEMGQGDGPPVLVVSNERWHPGIVGLVASRLKERFARPAIAIALREDGTGTGSARSIQGFDIGALVRSAAEEGLLVKGGGHAMAAGLSIARARLADFRAFCEERAGQKVAALAAFDVLAIDAAVSARGMTLELATTIERAGPFGSGHAAPVVALARHRLDGVTRIGASGHLRANLRSPDGAIVQAVAFRAEGTALGDRLLKGGDRPVHVAGTPSVDRFRNEPRVSLRIIDIADAP